MSEPSYIGLQYHVGSLQIALVITIMVAITTTGLAFAFKAALPKDDSLLHSSETATIPFPQSSTMLYSARLMQVIDGDTLDCDVVVWPDTTIRARVRLVEVDAPELTGDTKTQGLEAKMWLVETLQQTQGRLWLQNLGREKYGRWIVRLWLSTEGTTGFEPSSETSLNTQLVKAGHAVDLRKNSD